MPAVTRTRAHGRLADDAGVRVGFARRALWHPRHRRISDHRFVVITNRASSGADSATLDAGNAAYKARLRDAQLVIQRALKHGNN